MSRATTTAPGSSSAPRYRPICTTAEDPTADCTLKQPVHPRFFCGQLLTDRDLTDLRAWGEDRLRLARFRDGWGVACGLDVWTSPGRLDTLTVGPGYALSCCGLDLVVAEPTTFDIGRICRPQPSICEGGVEVEGVTSGNGGDGEAAFDVYLRAREQPLDPRPAPRRGCCADSAGCEYTRAREDIELVAIKAGSLPAADDPCQSYRAWRNDIRAFLRKVRSEQPSDALKDLRTRVLQKKRLQFPRLLDRIKAEPTESDLPETLFWLVLNERATLLAGPSGACPSCSGAPGVPLARIWVAPRGATGQQVCSVAWIDAFPPYRRPLHRDDPWITPAGEVNLGPALGRPWLDEGRELIALLGARGVHLEGMTSFAPATQPVETLLDFGGHDLCVTRGTTLTALVYDSPPLGPIVVGFGSGGEAARPAPERGRPPGDRPATPKSEGAANGPGAEAKPAPAEATKPEAAPAPETGAEPPAGPTDPGH